MKNVWNMGIFFLILIGGAILLENIHLEDSFFAYMVYAGVIFLLCDWLSQKY